MSYILEALKKSEKERRQKTQDPPHTSEPIRNEAQQPKRQRTVILLICALLVLVALLTALTVAVRTILSDTRQVPAKQSPMLQQMATASPPVPSGEAKKTPQIQEIPITIGPAKRKKRKIRSPQPAKEQTAPIPLFTAAAETPIPKQKKKETVYEPQPLQSEKEADHPEPLRTAEKHTKGTLDEAIRESNAKYREIPYYEDLDDTDKARLPRLKLSGHTYAQEPSRRLVLINSAIVHEGEMVEHQLLLKEILPDSVILCREAQCFRLTATSVFHH